MMETVRDRTDSLGVADLNEQDKQAQRLSQLEKTVNNLQTELRTNQEGTRAWRIRAFGALCIFAILPLAILTIVTLLKENNLEESEAQLAAQMASMEESVDKVEESEVQMAAQMKNTMDKVQKLEKRSAHCGFQNAWGSQSVITYDRIITEEGNSSFDKNTGIWTAGFSGVYQVFWSVENSVDASEANIIYLERNGVQVGESRHYAYKSDSGYTAELGGRTMLLSMRAKDTLALKSTYVRDTISNILFCVNLLYADDNISPSVTTRMEGSGNPIGDKDIQETSGLNDDYL